MANNITTESDEGREGEREERREGGKERGRKGEREGRRERGKERGRKGEREEQGGREREGEREGRREGEINSIPNFPGQRMKCLACNIL